MAENWSWPPDSQFAPDPKFPCTLKLKLPFPNATLATHAASALSVDAELSSLVRRRFSVSGTNLVVDYGAATNRMLRVSVNGFFEALNLVLEVMRECDVDVVMEGGEDLEGRGVQGLERLKKAES